MARLEGIEGAARALHVSAGQAQATHGDAAERRRGVARVGLALFAASLVAVNWAGWARYGGGGAAARAAEASANATDEAPTAAKLGPLTIAHVLPTQDITATDRLTIVFDGPVVTAAVGGDLSTGGRTDAASGVESNAATLPELTAAPFQSDVDLAGRWEWASPTSLAFVLERPLTPGRVVELRPTSALEQLAGRPVAAGTVARWETGPLKLCSAKLRSADPRAATVELEFNAPVDAAQLVSALRFEDARDQIQLGRSKAAPAAEGQVLTVGAHVRHTVRFERPSGRYDRVKEFAAVLPQGFLPAVGTLGLADIARSAFTIPFEFDTVNTWIEHSDGTTQSVIHVWFDRALDSAQETPPVNVEPAVVPLTARVSGHELILEGPFVPRTRYTITIGASLLAADGKTLGRERRIGVDVPARNPSLSIAHDDGILTPGGGLSLVLDVTNVPSVHVTAHEVLPGNLVPHLRGEDDHHTSRRIFSRTIPLDLELDVPARRVLDLRALFAESADGVRGVYSVQVASFGDYWRRDYATVRITDLAPTVKQDADGYHVWVRSITTGEPIPGATVSALTVTDQLVGSARTDEAGYAALPVPADHVDGRAYVVTVEHAGDLGYVEVSGATWNVPRELTEGRAAPRDADVFLYPERRLYRPGDTVHLSGIARTPAGEVLARELRIVVERPDGITWLDTRVTPDLAQGVFHVDVPTELDARTGTWQVSAFIVDGAGHAGSDGRPVGRARFNVEAFLAARLVITAERPSSTKSVAADTDVPTRGAALLSATSVRSLAGTSVEDFPIAAVARWTPITFRSARHAEFHFDLDGDVRSAVRAEWAGALDAEGRVSVTVPGAELLGPGRWQGRIDWTVTEPGGRSASTSESVQHDTPALHLGLALGALQDERVLDSSERAAAFVAIGAPLTVRWVAVDHLDAPVTPPRLGWELVCVTHEGRIENVGGHLAWVHREVTEIVATGLAMATAGAPDAGSFDLPCDTPGHYRVVLRAEGGPAVTRDLYVVEGDVDTFVPPLEDLEAVVLSPLVPAARPGDTIEVDVRAPFDGSLLFTLEDTHLRSQQRVDLVGGSARLSVKLPSDLRGGAFLSAQVTRPLERGAAWRPHRAYGWTRVRTLHDERTLDVVIDAPAQVRPGARATVTVAHGSPETLDPTRPAAVHLYAVDEGIRVTGGDRRPEPADHFFAPRAHSTHTTDAWLELLPDLELPPEVRRIGGDGDFEAGEARRRAPERVHRAPGVVWQGYMELGADGKRVFELDVPDFVGTLTWLAVVVDGDRYGSGEARTLLRSEVPLQASFPRFVAPGDVFLVPLVYENTTQVDAHVALSLQLDGPFELVRELDGTGADVVGTLAAAVALEPSTEDSRRPAGWKLSDGTLADAGTALAPGATARRWLELRATDVFSSDTRRIGGSVRLVGTLADGRSVDESVAVDVPVRTGRPLVALGLVRAIPAGEHVTLDLMQELGLDPKDGISTAELTLSSSFEAGLEPMSSYVLDYPYGCAEQTASRIYALLALPRAVQAGDGLDDAGRRGQKIDERIAAGLDRLWSMQAPEGGIVYWPGSLETSNWATLYVAELLHACREAGQPVSDDFVRRLASTLEECLQERQSVSSRAHLVRVLAALGRPQPGWSKRLGEQVSQLDRGGLVELAFAAVLAGRSDEARVLLATTPTPVVEPLDDEEVTEIDVAAQRLRSPVRTLALELRVRLVLDPLDAEIPRLLTALESHRRASASGRYSSTIDNAAVLFALARYRALCEGTAAEWQGTLTTAAGRSAVRSDGEVRLDADAAVPVQLTTSGVGTAWLTAQVTGRRASDAPASDRGLVVRRRWLDGAGAEIDHAAVPLGTLVTVEVTLSTDGRADVGDVALVDALPGGFEVENPRLANTTIVDDEPSALSRLYPDRVEFLDDRVVVFATAPQRIAVLRYHLRAVALGTFERAPVQVEAMYEPEVSSIGGPTTTVTVVR
jgi:uncharacterized protein YfaS (alpha-2-macroglobulin family)